MNTYELQYTDKMGGSLEITSELDPYHFAEMILRCNTELRWAECALESSQFGDIHPWNGSVPHKLYLAGQSIAFITKLERPYRGQIDIVKALITDPSKPVLHGREVIINHELDTHVQAPPLAYHFATDTKFRIL